MRLADAPPASRGGMRWGEDDTPGWPMMTERERADSWRYLELFYALQLRPLAAGMAP